MWEVINKTLGTLSAFVLFFSAIAVLYLGFEYGGCGCHHSDNSKGETVDDKTFVELVDNLRSEAKEKNISLENVNYILDYAEKIRNKN